MSALVKGLIVVSAALGLTTFSQTELVSDIIAVLSSTPVFGLAMLILGQWLGEVIDALFYRREGGFGGASARPLRWRLRFTRSVLDGPFWYPNQDRISREVERTNRALKATKFAQIGKWDPDDEQRIGQNADHRLACSALILRHDMKKAVQISGRLLRCLREIHRVEIADFHVVTPINGWSAGA